MIFFYKIIFFILHQNTYLILYLYRMAAATAQELCKSWNLLNAIAEQKALTLCFLTVLKNG